MEEPTSYRKRPLDNFYKWIHSICVVTFDLELGQAMELIFPKISHLTDSEKMNISYLAFPDSNSSFLGDTQYSFRFRSSLNRSFYKKHLDFNSNSYPVHLRPVIGHCFGHVFFRQVKDASLKRGYFQKSVVLISPLPFHSLFTKVVRLIAPNFFDNGPVGLEVACHDIDQWPAPRASTPLQLPLFGQVLSLCVPSAHSLLLLQKRFLESRTHTHAHTNSEATNGTTHTPAEAARGGGGLAEEFVSVSELDLEEEDGGSLAGNYECFSSVAAADDASGRSDVTAHTPHSAHRSSLAAALCPVSRDDVYAALRTVLPQLPVLWELVVTCQPLLVLCPSPVLSSRTVLALVSAIFPLRFIAEYRPFFTIHDAEFKEFTSKTQNPPPVILGASNPFFAKALSNWPNILRVGSPLCPISRDRHRKKPSYFVKQDSDVIKPGLYSEYRPFLSVSSQIRAHEALLRLDEILASHDDAQLDSQSMLIAQLIQQFFLSMTLRFLQPLENYVTSLMPLKKLINPFKALPNIRRFDREEFLGGLASSQSAHAASTSGRHIKGDWTGLYRAFINSANFADWLAHRELEIRRELELQYLESLCDVRVSEWAFGRAEVEIVDFVIAINNRLHWTEQNVLRPSAQQTEKLKQKIDELMALLPSDLCEAVRQSVTGSGAPLSNAAVAAAAAESDDAIPITDQAEQRGDEERQSETISSDIENKS